MHPTPAEPKHRNHENTAHVGKSKVGAASHNNVLPLCQINGCQNLPKPCLLSGAKDELQAWSQKNLKQHDSSERVPTPRT